MEKGFFDISVDLMEETVNDVVAEVDRMFEGVKPFQMEPMSDEEVIAQYMNIPENIIEQFRQQVPEVTRKFEDKVSKAMFRRARRNGGYGI
jgi:hypothetical protein